MPIRPRSRVVSRLALAAALVFAFFALRSPLYIEPGALLGWNSDAALYGLMARAMVETGRPIFLFWGEDYLGTLTSMWAVAASTVVGGVNPLALRLGAGAGLVAAILLFGSALTRVYGITAASIGAFWVAAGPSFLFKLSYAPLSAEQMFFVGAIVFWYVVRAPLTRGVQWVVLGVGCGVGWWAHRGTLFVVLPAVALGLFYDRWAFPLRRVAIAGLCFAAGAASGLLPQILGSRDIDQRLYTPVTSRWSLTHVAEQIGSLAETDLWSFLGTEAGPLPGAVGALVLFFAAWGLRHTALSRGHLFAAGVVITTFGFWLFSTQAYPGAVRYLVLALPIVYTWIAHGILTLVGTRSVPRTLGSIGLVLALGAGLYVPRYREAHAVASGAGEQHGKWPGAFDPRPALAHIARERYPVCYADFWVAYKLEWLSTTGVKFIPYRSVDRSQKRSLRLAFSNGKKCFVTLGGDVRTLTVEEEAAFRADTVRLVSSLDFLR